jgi:hypothetical protein
VSKLVKMKPSEIITAVIAVYGAVLSTIAIVRQLLGDRVKIKLTVKRNMQIMGDPRYGGKTLTLIEVTNVGRRPVTIKSFGAIGLYPHLSLAVYDSQPQLPHEITEGQYIQSYWDQADLDFSTIDYWAAWDSHGRVYKLHDMGRMILRACQWS